jgi:hypothetical protein
MACPAAVSHSMVGRAADTCPRHFRTRHILSELPPVRSPLAALFRTFSTKAQLRRRVRTRAMIKASHRGSQGQTQSLPALPTWRSRGLSTQRPDSPCEVQFSRHRRKKYPQTGRIVDQGNVDGKFPVSRDELFRSIKWINDPSGFQRADSVWNASPLFAENRVRGLLRMFISQMRRTIRFVSGGCHFRSHRSPMRHTHP